jgi:hypothetical protein
VEERNDLWRWQKKKSVVVQFEAPPLPTVKPAKISGHFRVVPLNLLNPAAGAFQVAVKTGRQ